MTSSTLVPTLRVGMPSGTLGVLFDLHPSLVILEDP
jgi:hypothetical protein